MTSGREERVEDTQENRAKCLCPGCPSYPHLCEGELLYCAVGPSACEIMADGCTCPSCQVYRDNGLKFLYYCNQVEVGREGIYMRRQRAAEDASTYGSMVDIKAVAETGEGKVCAMGSLKDTGLSLDELHFIPAQVARPHQ